MFVGAGGIRAASSVPMEANLLTCSCLPEAVCKGEELGGGCATGMVDAQEAATKNAVVAKGGVKGTVAPRGMREE